MKIIHLVNSLDCGGQEKMLMALAVSLKAKGHDNQIVGIANKGVLTLQAEKRGIKVHSIYQEKGFSLIALWRLFKLLKVERPDIVHLHNARPLIYGSIAARILNIPCVFTRHGSGSLVSRDWIWSNIKSIIAISSQAKADLLKQNLCLKPKKVSIILNGVDTAAYQMVHANEGNRNASLVVGHVARLSVEKDQETLLRSFARVIAALPDLVVKLVIVGEGVERLKLEQLAGELHITREVEFLGFREDIPSIVNVFDVFVLSSLTEGISLTLLEAMAASKPIVVTNVGGNPEVVVDGVTGFLVPPQDPQAMADKILALLKDSPLAQKMGAEGRKRVEQVFSLERMVDEYEKVYNGILL